MTSRTSCDRLVLWDIDFTLLNPGGFGRSAMLAAFETLFGFSVEATVAGHGRTDRAILEDFLRVTGIAQERLEDLQQKAAEIAESRASQFVAGGARLLPGADAALTALGGLPGVVQTVLTGNLRRIGVVKLEALGLAEHLNLDLASFGDDHLVRADLVDVARGLAAASYGGNLAPADTVIIGDTPLDVEAALDRGALAIGVATGASSEGDLVAAGAHRVFADLRDTAALVEAVTGAEASANSLSVP